MKNQEISNPNVNLSESLFSPKNFHSINKGLQFIFPYFYYYSANESAQLSVKKISILIAILIFELISYISVVSLSHFTSGIDLALQRDADFLMKMSINFLTAHFTFAIVNLIQKSLLTCLSNDIANEIFQNVASKYLDSELKPYKYMEVEEKFDRQVKREHIMLHNSQYIAYHSLDLTYCALKSSLGTLISLYQLRKILPNLNSYNLQTTSRFLQNISQIYQTPMFPIGFVVLYALAINILPVMLASKISTFQRIKRYAYSSVMSKIQNVEYNKDAISYLAGEEYERKRIFQESKHFFRNENKFIIANEAQNSMKKVISYVNMVVANLIMMPYVFQKTIEASKFGSVSLHIQRIVEGFSFWNGSYDARLKNLDYRIEEIKKFTKLINRIGETRDLSYSRSKFKAVRNFYDFKISSTKITTGKFSLEQTQDLIIKNNKVTLIQARSGYGKSTFLKALAGGQKDYIIELESHISKVRAQNGQKKIIYIGKEIVKNVNSFYDLIFYPNYENVSKQDENFAKTLIRQFGIRSSYFEQPSSHSVGELSNGEKSIALLINALLKRPSLLIIDETFSSLDIVTSTVIQDYLKRKKMTILLVDHNARDLKKNGFIDNVIDFEEHFVRITGSSVASPSDLKDMAQGPLWQSSGLDDFSPSKRRSPVSNIRLRSNSLSDYVKEQKGARRGLKF